MSVDTLAIVMLLMGAGAGAALGFLAGTSIERDAWKTRAMPKNQTPHHCDGEFYYVIPERVFCEEYTPKQIVPPQGGSGTAPPRIDARP